MNLPIEHSQPPTVSEAIMDPQYLDQWEESTVLAPVENPRFFLPEEPSPPAETDGCALTVVEAEEFRARWWPASDPA